MILVNACDQDYFEMTQALIGSVLKNTTYSICVYLVNIEEEIRHPRVIEFHVKQNFVSDGHKRDYMANLRASLFMKLYGLYKEPMLWLDSDSLVRWPLIDLENDLESYDTAAVDTPEMARVEYNEKLISTVAIGHSEGALDFLVEWNRQLDELRAAKDYEYSIMTVQLAYIRAVKVVKPLYKDLTYFYSDKYFKNESPIHEAQGNRKEDARYLKQKDEYLRIYKCLVASPTV